MKNQNAQAKLDALSLAIRDACIDLHNLQDSLQPIDDVDGLVDPMKASLVRLEAKFRNLLLGESQEKLFGLEIINQEAWDWYNGRNLYGDNLSEIDPKVYHALLAMDDHSLSIRGLAKVKAEDAPPAPARTRRPRAR